MASYERYREYASALAASWAANNPVLLIGQVAVESDTGLMKIGNGSTAYTSLPYGPTSVTSLTLLGGTANGVLFLDTNKLITSGTALAFNGTTLSAPAVQVDNLNLDGNTILATNTNGGLNLTPNGTGRVTVTNLTTTSPRIVTGINDTNGNELFLFTATASAVNEVTLANAATGFGPRFTATGGDININLVFEAKGTGQVQERITSTNYALASQFDVGTEPNDIPLNQYLGTLAFQSAEAVSVGFIRSNAINGSGYALGAGGAITQATSRTTGVTVNAACGAITLVSAAGSTSPSSFTVTNSSVVATDVIILSQKSGTDKYVLLVTAVGAGSFEITAYTTGGTTTEQPVINFAVIKAVTA
jgi:hypothetical protein